MDSQNSECCEKVMEQCVFAVSSRERTGPLDETRRKQMRWWVLFMGGRPGYFLLKHIVDAGSLLNKLLDVETF